MKTQIAELMSVAGISRPGDIETLAMMDCPVFCIQEMVSKCEETGLESWQTVESIWFTHEAAHKWARAHPHRLSDPWRVYGIAARGELRSILTAHTERESK